MPFSTNPKVQIVDASGDSCDDDSGKLNVNATLVAGDSIDIGDVEIKGHVQVGIGTNTDVGTSAEYLYGDSTSVACKHVDIMAAIANTGIIYVGATGVTAATGIALYAGDVYSVDIENLNLLYVLASVDGEDVQWVVYN